MGICSSCEIDSYPSHCHEPHYTKPPSCYENDCSSSWSNHQPCHTPIIRPGTTIYEYNRYPYSYTVEAPPPYNPGSI